MFYRERLYPSPAMLIVAALFAASFGLIAVPFSVPLAIVIALVAGVAVPALLWASAPRITLSREGTKTVLRCSGAHISLGYIGDTRLVDEAGIKQALRAENEGRYWICYSSAVPQALEVEIVDEADPHEAWLICSRSPQRLQAALATE
ncbi:MAG: DUF3093 family protein [Flaviflexus sp.]|nr:DUF3093 family protein [Flaviflexus sp.]